MVGVEPTARCAPARSWPGTRMLHPVVSLVNAVEPVACGAVEAAAGELNEVVDLLLERVHAASLPREPRAGERTTRRPRRPKPVTPAVAHATLAVREVPEVSRVSPGVRSPPARSHHEQRARVAAHDTEPLTLGARGSPPTTRSHSRLARAGSETCSRT